MCVHECRLSKYDVFQPQGWQKLLALVLPARRSIRSKLLSIGSGAMPHPPTHFLHFKVFWRALLAMFIRYFKSSDRKSTSSVSFIYKANETVTIRYSIISWRQRGRKDTRHNPELQGEWVKINNYTYVHWGTPLGA